MSSKPVLGYWDILGRAESIRLLLRYAKVDFEDKRYAIDDQDFTKSTWFQEKPNLGLDFPNIPYFKDDKVHISQARAILHYVAKKYGVYPETLEEEATAEMVMEVAAEIVMVLISHCYKITSQFTKPVDEAVQNNLKELAKFLGAKKWVLGDKMCHTDFFLYVTLSTFKKYKVDFFKDHPVLAAYIERFEAIPHLADYIKSNRNLFFCGPLAPNRL